MASYDDLLRDRCGVKSGLKARGDHIVRDVGYVTQECSLGANYSRLSGRFERRLQLPAFEVGAAMLGGDGGDVQIDG